MLKKFLVAVVYGACTLAALTSCGDNKAAGTGEFSTVYVTAAPSTSTVDADVAKWVDVSGTGAASPCSSTSAPTFAPNDVTYNISVTPYNSPNTGSSSPIATSDIIISRITLTLTPANSSTPALPLLFSTQYLGSGQRIPAGGGTVSVRLVSDALKSFLFKDKGLNCDNPGAFFTYRATVSFEALEVNTNRSSTITAPGFVQVSIADFSDSGP